MSYHSTLQYYEGINQLVNDKSGSMTSADLVIRSVNFEQYYKWMQNGEWDAISNSLCAEACELAYDMHCDYIAIATNTMHKVAEDIEGTISGRRADGVQPHLVHIGDCVAEKCKKNRVRRIVLLGTRFTMTDSFMKSRLRQNGLEIVDNFTGAEISIIDHIIFNELCKGEVKPGSKETVLDIVSQANSYDLDAGGSGIEGVILGCTELGMLLESGPMMITWSKQGRLLKFFDTTEAHIGKLAQLCLFY
jgi:aspartate racemase